MTLDVPIHSVVPDFGTDWKYAAPCFQMPADAFYPDEGDRYNSTAGWDVCGTCPLKLECLATALRDEEQFGLFAQTSPDHRKMLATGLLRGTMNWTDVTNML